MRAAFFSSTLLAVANLSAPSAWAQVASPADLRAVQDEARRQENTTERETEARRAAQRARGETPTVDAAAQDPLAPMPGGPCFVLHDIILSGFEEIGDAPKGYEALIGSCATAADIAEALNAINVFYQERGYITTRAYVPKQDVADGSLEITVVPGKIERFVYADGTEADARIAAGFPTSAGDILYLRDLEQGLDNINAPRSAKGWFRLLPGTAPGGSIIAVNVDDQLPWHLNIGLNNAGFETTGVYKLSAEIGQDNVLGLSDQLRVNLSTTPLDQRSDKYSEAASAHWLLPVGYWSFAADAGASRYYFVLDGINQSFPVEGYSYYGTAFAERLLWRDRAAKMYAYADLKLTRTRSFIDDIEIESQRRNLTIGRIGLRGENNIEQGKFTWDVNSKFGLDLFDAYVFDKSIVNPHFHLVAARFTLEKGLGDTGLSYKATLAGQQSDAILPSSEQFSIGGWSTVRGFHADNMYGDSGAYIQNTLEWTAFDDGVVAMTFSAGLDAGYIHPSALRNWSQDYLFGASLGVRFEILDHVTVMAQGGHALSRPEDNPPNAQPAFEGREAVGFLGVKIAL